MDMSILIGGSQGLEEVAELEAVEIVPLKESPAASMKDFGKELVVFDAPCVFYRRKPGYRGKIVECSLGRIRLQQSLEEPNKSRIDFTRWRDGRRSINFALKVIHEVYEEQEGVDHFVAFQLRGIDDEVFRVRFGSNATRWAFVNMIFAYAKDAPPPEQAELFPPAPAEKVGLGKRLRKFCAIS